MIAMKKALVVASVGGFIDFEKSNIHILQELGYEVSIACNIEGWERNLKGIGCKIINIPFSRSPYSIDNLRAFFEIQRLLAQNKYDLIHCHTPVCGILTRLAANKTRKNGTVVLYTAHGFHFYNKAPIKNWLLYYPVEWLCSFKTDILITINTEDYRLAKRHFHAKQLFYVPGVGIDIKSIDDIKCNRKEIRNKLGISEQNKMLFSVGELNKNKNHELVIKAISRIGDRRLQYYIAGNGDYGSYLLKIARKYGVADNVHLLGWRTDIIELNKAADVFCFPSLREGLSVALMEAIACGVPAICSDIRGNRDLKEDCEGVQTFDTNQINDVIKKLKYALNVKNVNRDGIEKYSIENIQRKMKIIYSGADRI